MNENLANLKRERDSCDVNMEEYLALHENVYIGDLKTVSKLLRTQDCARKDKHGKFYKVKVKRSARTSYNRCFYVCSDALSFKDFDSE